MLPHQLEWVLEFWVRVNKQTLAYITLSCSIVKMLYEQHKYNNRKLAHSVEQIAAASLSLVYTGKEVQAQAQGLGVPEV